MGIYNLRTSRRARGLVPNRRRGAASNKVARAREQALSEIVRDAPFEAYGFDIDPAAVELAAHNAKLAGVGEKCRFSVAVVRKFSPASRSLVFTNPPYGERLGSLDEAAGLAKILGKRLEESPVRGAYIITADAEFESHFGRRARRRRKLYNGMIPCQVYMYFSEKK